MTEVPRFRKLRLKLLLEQHRSLSKDYEDVFHQKMNTDDRDEQNRLERKLTEKQALIEQQDAEISALQRSDNSVSTASNDRLCRILENYHNDLSQPISWAYRACGLLGEVPEQYERLLSRLSGYPSGDSSYSMVEKFVAYLMICPTIADDVKDELKTWGLQKNAYFQSLVDKLSVSTKNVDGHSYLLVKLRLSQQDTMQQQSKIAKYFVDVWVIPSWSAYLENRSTGSSRVEISEYSLQEKTYSLSELPDILAECLNECSESCSKPIIELFLPTDLLGRHDIDRQTIEGDLQSLGSQYVIVVRSSDRLTRRYRRFRERWESRWDVLEGSTEQMVSTRIRSPFCEHCGESETVKDCDSLQMLASQLATDQDVVGLKFIPQCTERTTQEMLTVVYQLGLPLAVWLRAGSSGASHWPQLDRLLNCPWVELPEQVRQRRLAANAEPRRMGQFLSLLWEHPKRLPPDVDYAS